MRSKFKWIFTLLTAFAMQVSMAQQKAVTGVVSDQGGPLPSANVVVKGTQRSTQTGIDGTYTIQVAPGEVLEFSYVGYLTQTITVDARAKYDVVLSAEQLEEVVVVAYGAQTKESIAGSVGEIKAAEISNITTGNVLQGITGKVAGVQVFNTSGMPGDPPQIRMRGVGSLNGNTDPLYVVDGVPFNGDVAMLNSSDIESMTFLKDAAAAALYGNRGANGVVIITTKKGKSGKVSVDIDSRAGVSTRAVRDYDIIDSESRYYEAFFQASKNSYIASGMSATDAANLASSTLINGGAYSLRYNSYTTPGDQLIDPATGQFTGGSLKYSERWKDYLFQTGFFTQTHMNVSGATDNTSYFFSTGYDKNEGYVVNSGFERVTTRGRIETKITDRIKAGVNMTYSTFNQSFVADYQGGSGAYSAPFSFVRSIAPIYPVYLYDNDGAPVLGVNGQQLLDDGTGLPGDSNVPVRPYAPIQSPYATSLYNIDRYKTDNIFVNGFAEAELFDGLTFNYNATMDYNMWTQNQMDTPLYGDAVSVGGRLRYQTRKTRAFTQQQLLKYNKTFGRHSIDFLAGHETLDRFWDNTYLERQYVIIPDGIINHGQIHSIGPGGGNQQWINRYKLEGYFTRLNYDFDKRYYVNASFRRDASSRFHPDNRWGNFYGVGAAWRLSQESFMESTKGWLNELRFKGSYGEQGNDNIGDFLYTRVLTINPLAAPDPANPFATSIENPNYFPNPDISWETNLNFNVGFDAAFFNNRLNVEAEYFERKIEGMLFNRPYAPSSGLLTTPANLGDMNNKGFEVSISADVVRTTDFTVSLSANATSYKNKITALPDDSSLPGDRIIVSSTRAYQEGHDFSEYFIRDFAGVNPNNGAALFWANDGSPENDGTRQYLTEDWSQAEQFFVGKSAIPDVYGGFGANVRYKWIDLGIQFAYQFGGYSYDGVWAGLISPSEVGANMHNDTFDAWTVDNPNATLPRAEVTDPELYYSPSTLGLIKSDYLSIQNISIGYTFDQKVVEKLGIASLRIYGLADNVALWSKRQGFDPRNGGFTGASTDNYSLLRTVSFGLNVKL